MARKKASTSSSKGSCPRPGSSCTLTLGKGSRNLRDLCGLTTRSFSARITSTFVLGRASTRMSNSSSGMSPRLSLGNDLACALANRTRPGSHPLCTAGH
eukprot:scaffold132_cov170-Amphora_coffeaeformis.AAC.47